MLQLLERIAQLPDAARDYADTMLYVERVVGHTVVPAAMAAWVTATFGDLARVEQQTIVKVVNRLTLEGALFNPLRALRPAGATGSDEVIDAWIAAELGANDFFANPLTLTTADRFGRVRGKYCVTAANVAKYDGLHGLVIFDEPHPLRFDAARLADYFATALRWIDHAAQEDPLAYYPLLIWNCLPRSGATLAHGHMQIALTRGLPYVRVEAWRRAAVAYRAQTQREYCADFADLHTALGLAVPAAPGVRAMAHLIPQRNRELMYFAEPGAALAERLAESIAPALAHLIGVRGVRCFNLAIALPPHGAAAQSWELPVLMRWGDRGYPLTPRSDWGAMELYGTGSITEDPFALAEELRAM